MMGSVSHKTTLGSGSAAKTNQNVLTFGVSILLSVGIVLLFVALMPDRFLHWFVVPLLGSGVIIGLDVVDWFRGRLDVFDPIGCLGLLGYHFFFLAPLLHVQTDFWMGLVAAPEDWREWLGWMAVVNFVGLVAYRWGLGTAARRPPLVTTERKIVWKRFAPILLVSLTLTALLQLMVYRQFGGIMGYVQSFEAQDAAFAGMGFTFMISESFPVLALTGFAVWTRYHERTPGWGQILLVLVLFLVARMFFGGFRGSRSNTIWALFWAAGIIHFWVRRLPKAMVYVGLAFLVLFMYFYGFYKGAGVDVVRAFQGAQARAELAEETGRSMETVLLGDLGRSDVQAFLLYRLTRPDSDYRYALGRTYVGAVTLLVPRSVWADRPPTKQKAGTEAQYGTSSYYPGVWQSTRIYGLAGEAMLNFGPVSIPFAYLVFGFLVGLLKRYIAALQSQDVRQILTPFLVCLCFVVLSSDSDNIVFVLVKNGAVPALVLLLSSVSVRSSIAR